MTPLGWVEELRPFAGPDPAPLIPLAVVAAALLLVAGIVTRTRDVGSGLLPARDSARPRLGLLSSATGEAFRAERGSLTAWALGIGLFALTVGILSTAFSKANLSTSLENELKRLGGTSIVTPAGALGFYFVFFVLAISLFACSQVAAARREEVDQRLELLLALPLARARWLAGRLGLACAAAVTLALVAGLLAWAGSAAENAGVSLPRLLGAGANTLPAVFCFLGIAVLAYGLLPRASVGIAYGIVVAAFLWQLFGSIVGSPHWLLSLTPFQHVAPVPAEAFRSRRGSGDGRDRPHGDRRGLRIVRKAGSDRRLRTLKAATHSRISLSGRRSAAETAADTCRCGAECVRRRSDARAASLRARRLGAETRLRLRATLSTLYRTDPLEKPRMSFAPRGATRAAQDLPIEIVAAQHRDITDPVRMYAHEIVDADESQAIL